MNPIDIESSTEPANPNQAVALRQEQPIGAALAPADIAGKPPVTAAQAKIEAIGQLTMRVYANASTLKLTTQEIEALQADFPDDAFQPGAAGKENLIYIEHAHLRDRMNKVFGPGQWSIIPRNRWAEPFKTYKGVEGSRVYVEAMLLVRGAFVSEAVGAMEYYPKNESQNYGDAVEGAKTAALRRCAKELGIGLQAWKKEWCEGWWTRKRAKQGSGNRSTAQNRPSQASQPPQPQANATSRGATPPKPPPGAPGAVSAPNHVRPIHPAIFADEETRARMIEGLRECEQLALEDSGALRNPSLLLPGETMADVPLRWVPVTKRQFDLLKAAIADFGNGDEAKHAFAPNPDAPTRKEAAAPKPEPAKTGAPAELQSVAAAKAKDPEFFWTLFAPSPERE